MSSGGRLPQSVANHRRVQPPSSGPKMRRLLLLLTAITGIEGQSCGPKVSARLLREIPCDMSAVGYCTQPGSAYPWSSVRRYIHENQGFVKRMYGEQRQSQVVREELHSLNDRYEQIDNSLRSGKKENLPEEVNSVNSLNSSDGVQADEEEEVAAAAVMEESFTTSTSDMNTEQLYFDQQADFDQTTEKSDVNGGGGEEEEVAGEGDKPVKGFNACPVSQEVVAPYWANNTRGETLALLNVYPFEQYIHWEKCSFEREQMFCRDGCRCEQQYRLHRLLAFDPKNECRGIFADWFRFPGCCVCICYHNHERINNRKARL